MCWQLSPLTSIFGSSVLSELVSLVAVYSSMHFAPSPCDGDLEVVIVCMRRFRFRPCVWLYKAWWALAQTGTVMMLGCMGAYIAVRVA
mmetsp:Transcript_104776/g.263836  ORF Transcript_104776/g.263836 Transcript_104776/m.263836 type:complete len:88 (+) Transcript_104776:141-404(+)